MAATTPTSWMDIIHIVINALGIEFEHRRGLKFSTGFTVTDDEPNNQTVITAAPGAILVDQTTAGTVNATGATANTVLQSGAPTDGGVWNAALSLGATPGTGGNINLPDVASIVAYGPGPTSTSLVAKDAGDNLLIGSNMVANRPATVVIDAAGDTIVQAVGAEVFTAEATGISMPAANWVRLGLVAGSGAGSAAATGGWRLQGNGAVQGRIVFRDATDVGDIAGMSCLAADKLHIGGAYPTKPATIDIDATGTTRFMHAGSGRLQILGTTVQVDRPIRLSGQAPEIMFEIACVTPEVKQRDDPAAGVTGDDLTGMAQGVSDPAGNAVSGNWLLRGGRGTVHANNLDGNVALHEVPDDWQDMEEGCFGGNAVSPPTAAPVAGGFWWFASGLLTCMDTSGNVDDIGPVLNGYDEAVGQTTVAAALEDIAGCTFDITTTSTGSIMAAMSVECSASGVATGRWAISINAVDGTTIGRSMTTTAIGAMMVQAKSASLPPGTYTVKGRHYRSAGVATVNTDVAQLSAHFVAA